MVARRPLAMAAARQGRRPWLPPGARVDGVADDLRASATATARSSPEPAALRAIRAETERIMPGGAHMLTSHVQGLLLSLLVRLCGASRVLEIGCFTGYSALSMARAVGPAGHVVTCDRDDRTSDIAERHFAAATDAAAIRLMRGRALDTLAAMEGEEPFDLIFVDGDKRALRSYMEAIGARGLLAPRGFVVVDNTLFRGLVLAGPEGSPPLLASDGAVFAPPAGRRAVLAAAIHDFNAWLVNQPQWWPLLLPLRDGLTLVCAEANLPPGLRTTYVPEPGTAASPVALVHALHKYAATHSAVPATPADPGRAQRQAVASLRESLLAVVASRHRGVDGGVLAATEALARPLRSAGVPGVQVMDDALTAAPHPATGWALVVADMSPRAVAVVEHLTGGGLAPDALVLFICSAEEVDHCPALGPAVRRWATSYVSLPMLGGVAAAWRSPYPAG